MAFHLDGARREMAAGDLQPGLGCQRGQFGLPRPGAVAVGAARVRGDQQPPRLRVGSRALAEPPAAQRLHRECGGVMIGADIDPASVRRDVVDPVGDRLAQPRVGEVMGADLGRLALRVPLPAAVLVCPGQFLLLGVHADHRVFAAEMVFDLLVDVTELGIAVRVLAALQGLDAGLQAEALLMQQISDRISRDPVPLAGQFRRQHPQRLHRPPQRRHRIAPHIRFHQRQQGRPQARIKIGRALTATTGAAHPPQRLLTGLQLGDPAGHRAFAHPRRPGHHPDTAMPQRPGLSPRHQPPLPLIQMREQHLKLGGQRLLHLCRNAHSTTR